MKQEITEEFLYRYMPQAEEQWISAIEKQAGQKHEFSKRFEKHMKRILREGSRSKNMRKFMRITRRAAAVFLIILSVLLTITLSVEATREKLIELVRRIYADWTETEYNLKEGVDGKFRLIEPEYLPEGYREYEKEFFDHFYTIYYRNNGNEDTQIMYNEILADGLTVGMDTEDAEVKVITINGVDVEYFENKGIGYVTWIEGDTYFNLTGYIDVNELLQMAKSMIE